VKTSSRFSQRDTDEAGPIFRPNRRANGPRRPPQRIAPTSSSRLFPGILQTGVSFFLKIDAGATPSAAPR
jgi:hypothetical protein